MKKRISVIGYGGQGAWHCKQILASDVCELCGVYDIRKERCDAAIADGIKVYQSAEALVLDPECDAVVVATPNDVHFEQVVLSLQNKKHVICEKPVALSTAVFDKMVETAKENGCVFTVHQNRRWDVDYRAVKSVIESGEIDAPIRIESRIHGSRGIPSDWRAAKEHGGGMILDWGVHLIDQILGLVPQKITYVNCITTHITNTEVDDGFRLEILFEDGTSGYVEVGTYNFLAMPRFYMQCRKGTMIIEDWQKNAKIARLTAWQEKDVLPVQNAAGITKTMAPRDSLTLDTYEIERPKTDVHEFYRNFCDVIDGRAELIVKPHQVRRVLCVMEAAFESAKTKTSIKTDI